MYQPQKVRIAQQPNNRLPSPQAAAGEGATLLAATSGSHITNISLDTWLILYPQYKLIFSYINKYKYIILY